MSYTEPMSRPRVQCNSFSWYLYMYKQKNKLKKNEKKIRRPIAVLYVFSIALILQNLIESAGTVQKHAGLAHIWEKERQAMERELSKAHHDITKQDSLIKGLQHARDRSAIIINPHHKSYVQLQTYKMRTLWPNKVRKNIIFRWKLYYTQW